MDTDEAAKAMIDGAVCGERLVHWRWNGTRFEYNNHKPDEWRPYREIPDTTAWFVVHAEGSREWAQEQARAGRLVRLELWAYGVYSGCDLDGFYTVDPPPAVKHRDRLRINDDNDAYATGWSIYKPPERASVQEQLQNLPHRKPHVVIDAPEPKPVGKVVRLAVNRMPCMDYAPTVTRPNGAETRVQELNPDHVVGFVYTLPDGQEVTQRCMGVVWCWFEDGNWIWNDWSYGVSDAQGGLVRPAKLTHVLWWVKGER